MIEKKLLNKIVELLIQNRREELINILNDEYQKNRTQKNSNTARDLDVLRTKIKSTMHSKSSHFDLSSVSSPQKSLLSMSQHSSTLKDIILDKREIGAVNQLIKEWGNRKNLESHNLFPTNKLLLWGPPGTGKSLLCKILSSELGMELVTLRLDEIISSYLGNTGKNIREAFEYANKNDIILLIEELDTIGKKRDDTNEIGELKRVVTVLLQNIDEFQQNSLLICTTNHPELLDSAIWRRFDTIIKFNNPKAKQRQKLFTYYLNGYTSKLDITPLVKYSDNYSPADIKQICIQSIKDFVLENEEITTSIVLKHLLNIRLMKTNKDTEKDRTYQIAKELVHDGYSLAEIAKITDVPYTTLRDNLI